MCARIRVQERGLNPPNGSWGMVKVRPTPTDGLFLNPLNGSWGIVKARPSPYGIGRLRLDLNHPPTAVGGIRARASFCRLDFNDPPTAVGGIHRTVQSSPGANAPRTVPEVAAVTTLNGH